ncbi:MAG: DsbA family oxidoreductase [Chitinophagales bacterium]
MKIDIWSDIMCPFCYIGKRRLEGALEQSGHKDEVKIVWHSFQLDPTMKSQPDKDLYSYLAERKGQSLEWSVRVHNQLAQTAKEAGLTYHFDKAVIANSFDAHRLIQLAKTHGLGDAAEERLFNAYFTDGKNISSHNTLLQIGMELGLRAIEVGEMLSSDAYADKVHEDIAMAQTLGISGVPFFVLNGKYGISGAQPTEVFTDALQQAWQEYEKENPLKNMNTQDNVCTPDGVCETVKTN